MDTVELKTNNSSHVVTYDANSKTVVTQIRDTAGQTVLQFPNTPFQGK